MNKEKRVTHATQDFQQNKVKENSSQYQEVYRSFMERPKTMLDVSLQTGILRANICRYVGHMEKRGIIQLLYKLNDIHTNSLAGYYTTDKSLFRPIKDSQLTLWED